MAGGMVFGQGDRGSLCSVVEEEEKRFFVLFSKLEREPPRIEREKGFYREDLGFKDV